MTGTADGKPPRNHTRTVWCAVVAVVIVAAVGLLAAVGHPAMARLVLVGCGAGLGAASGVTSIRAVHADPASLRPVTWGIWAMLTGLAAAASATTDDWPTTIFAAVGTTTCATVTIVVLRAGEHRFTRLDGACLGSAVARLAAWQTLDQPDLAAMAACAGDPAALTTRSGRAARPRSAAEASHARLTLTLRQLLP